MMDDWKGTKLRKAHSDLDYNEDSVHVACPVDMAEGLEEFFG